MRLIDADKLKTYLIEYLHYDHAIPWVDAQPTATECEECYKDCGECEAYDKEKNHCPKFCKVITEAVKEIEENHNIRGKWEMTYNGMRKNVNTGLMMASYHCKCSVCGWKTGNQGTRFNYCPNCGAKMDEVNQPKGE